MNVNELNNFSLGKKDVYKTCLELFGNGSTSDFLEFIKNDVLKIVWIGVPLLLILLTSFDFAKVVFNDDKDGMPNAVKRFGKRAIAAILIFLTPYIIILIANLTGADKAVQDCVKEIRNMTSTTFIASDLTK